MFAIESLWQHSELKPLQKVYEIDPQDRRLVVAIMGDNQVSLEETIALHQWAEKQAYRTIPATWETEDLETLDVVHVSKLALTILRRDPFSMTPAALTPNSWLNRLPQNRFDALLLAQECGDAPRQPTRMYIKDTLKPALEAEHLSGSWQDLVNDVAFAQSGQAPRNDRQKQVLIHWALAARRRHFDPTTDGGTPIVTTPPPPRTVVSRTYVWHDPGQPQTGWNWRMTALRKWIIAKTDPEGDALRAALTEIFGSTSGVGLSGKLVVLAQNAVDAALRHHKLNELASHYDFEMPDASPDQGNVFNQAGQHVGGMQLNVTIGAGANNVAVGSGVTQINTAGAAYIGRDANALGDMIAGDKISGSKITIINRT